MPIGADQGKLVKLSIEQRQAILHALGPDTEYEITGPALRAYLALAWLCGPLARDNSGSSTVASTPRLSGLQPARESGMCSGAATMASSPAAGWDPGMLRMLTMAVAGARRNRRHVGICGEAPANYPEIAKFLTGLGIDSISVNPSSVLRTMAIVHEAEQSMVGRKASAG